MKEIIALLLFVLLTPLAKTEENAVTWLKGTWKSNRELSIPTLKTKKPLSPEMREKLENMFGKMTTEFTNSEVTFDMPATEDRPAWRQTAAYSIASASDNKVSIRWSDPIAKKIETLIISFEGPDRYWVALPNPGWREYFDRVKNKP